MCILSNNFSLQYVENSFFFFFVLKNRFLLTIVCIGNLNFTNTRVRNRFVLNLKKIAIIIFYTVFL